jgi:hypothetical protein
VKSAGKNHGLRFTVDNDAVPAMNIWLMPGEAVGPVIIRRLWRSCARRKFATG